MNVAEALNSRHTVRAFKPDPLEQEKLMSIIEAASHTPSWANTQPWEIFAAGGDVLDRLRERCLERFRGDEPVNPDLPRPGDWPRAHKERMRQLGAERFTSLGIRRDDPEARTALSEQNYRFFDAPVVVYLCMDRSLSSWSIFDLGMMAQSIMLAAQEQGVGSAIAYNLVTYPDLIRHELGIPDELSIIIGIALGYTDDSDPQNRFRSSRRPLKEFTRLAGL